MLQSSPFASHSDFHGGASRTRENGGRGPAPNHSEEIFVADDNAEFWFWASPQGALKTVDRAELEAGLRSGDIAPQSLVWRQGWGEWLRAAEVSELSRAIAPAARLSPRVPKLDPDSTNPPPVPKSNGMSLDPIIPVASTPENDKPRTQLLEEAELSVTDLEPVEPPVAAPPPPSMRTAPKSAAPPRPAAARTKAAPMLQPKSPGKPAEANAPPAASWVEVAAPVTAPALQAAPMPAPAPEPKKATLSDLEAALPPRPAPVIVDELPTQDDNPIVLMPESDRDGATILRDAIVPVSDPENEAPTRVQASPLRDDALPSWSAEVDAQLQAPTPVAAPLPPPPVAAFPSVHPQATYDSYVPPKKSSAGLLIGGAVAVLLLGGGTLAAGLLYFKPWDKAATEAPGTQPSATPTGPAEPAASTASCKLSKGGSQLADSIAQNVPPQVASLGDGQIAIGFAASATAAVGLTVNPTTLEAKRAFDRNEPRAIVGVVPMVGSGSVSFAVDTDSGSLRMPRTVDHATPFVLGMSKDGYARTVGGQSPETVWEGGTTEKLTETRVATVDGFGHLITFRQGTEIKVGWLTSDGAKKSELAQIAAGGMRVGTPNVAAHETEGLVTFAARPSDDAPWSVRIARAKHGELPRASETFTIPAGGPGGDAIAPTATGLPGQRWLLQWTEGPAGKRLVRAQTLARDLSPLGEPITVSPADAEAGQGVIAVRGGETTAFYLVKAQAGYQLWASALECK